MRQFRCQCGRSVFFDSDICINCGTRLGYDPAAMRMEALTPQGDHWSTASGKPVRLCDNGVQFAVCNWVVDASLAHALCFGCRFNRIVPNQALPGNQQRWLRLEEGKKRLLYTLMQLGLPLENGWDAPRTGLLFDFKEDERSTGTYNETFVHTGYLGGVITINTLEADDAARESQRRQMNEEYRTVLGHMRHESGHYYWQRLNPDADTRAAFDAVFGNESADYGAALNRYYSEGPSPDWHKHHISAYASAHPTEDWAESWGHYLHIFDALDTAAAHGLTDRGPDRMDIAERIARWRTLSVTLNELNRSVGRGDAYPFVFNREVEKKLAFVDQVINLLQRRGSAAAGH